jgi:hypothetical protein
LRIVILLTCGKELHDVIISLRVEVLGPWNSSNPVTCYWQWLYLISQSKLYLPREHQIIKYIGMHKSNKMFIILSNVLNWVKKRHIEHIQEIKKFLHILCIMFKIIAFFIIRYNMWGLSFYSHVENGLVAVKTKF